MHGIVKGPVKRIARLFGLDVRRHNSLASGYTRLVRLLAANQVDLVLDIGANSGQWAQDLRGAGYIGDMISFEPLTAAHAALKANARTDPRWRVAPRMAIGERNAEEVEINVAGNSESSSLLGMLPMHLSGAPHSAYVRIEKAPMRMLDSLLDSIVPAECSRVFCKLDVQGYEANVLAGAELLLSRTVGFQLEMSLAPLYDGQPLFRDLLDTMAGCGFEIQGLSPGFVDPQSGRMLQIDGVFFRAAGMQDLREAP